MAAKGSTVGETPEAELASVLLHRRRRLVLFALPLLSLCFSLYPSQIGVGQRPEIEGRVWGFGEVMHGRVGGRRGRKKLAESR